MRRWRADRPRSSACSPSAWRAAPACPAASCRVAAPSARCRRSTCERRPAFDDPPPSLPAYRLSQDRSRQADEADTRVLQVVLAPAVAERQRSLQSVQGAEKSTQTMTATTAVVESILGRIRTVYRQ